MFAQQLIQASIEWVTRGLPHGCSGFKQYAVSFCRSTIARRAAFVGGEPEDRDRHGRPGVTVSLFAFHIVSSFLVH
jgi:hypothetical protein